MRRGRPRHERATELLRRLAAQPRAAAQAAAARQAHELAAQARALARAQPAG